MRRKSQRTLLFLCSGNVLRSAFCELYAKHLELPFRALSVGTEYRNHALFPESRRALEERGVSAELLDAFRPTHLEDLTEPIEDDALVYGMTHAHLAAFERIVGQNPKPQLILSVLGSDGEVADPFFHGGHAEVFATLTSCVDALAEWNS